MYGGSDQRWNTVQKVENLNPRTTKIPLLSKAFNSQLLSCIKKLNVSCSGKGHVQNAIDVPRNGEMDNHLNAWSGMQPKSLIIISFLY